jgi:hypothetical protein
MKRQVIYILIKLKEQREDELMMRKENNSRFKTEIKMSIEQKRKEKMDQIMEEARLLKEQKKNNEEIMRYIKNEEQSTNKTKCDYIKNQQILFEEKKRALEVNFWLMFSWIGKIR